VTTAERFLVFTDLDGTLLDAETYEWAEARPALDLLREQRVPLILCSSKTAAEMLPLARELGLDYPLIVENGGAVLVADGGPEPPQGWGPVGEGLRGLVLGPPYGELVASLARLGEESGARLRGFAGMETEEVMELTGLSRQGAELARARQYSEPFLYEGDEEGLKRLAVRAAAMGLRVVRGLRFHHLMGQTDKARALRVVRDLYAFRWAGGPIVSVGLGDSPNDVLMLQNVDIPVLVRQKSGEHFEPGCDIPGLYRTREAGPRGWNEALENLITGRRRSWETSFRTE
jgi:mannosyl-3-phosphoglycerate phosphatase family protein